MSTNDRSHGAPGPQAIGIDSAHQTTAFLHPAAMRAYEDRRRSTQTLYVAGEPAQTLKIYVRDRLYVLVTPQAEARAGDASPTPEVITFTYSGVRRVVCNDFCTERPGGEAAALDG